MHTTDQALRQCVPGQEAVVYVFASFQVASSAFCMARVLSNISTVVSFLDYLLRMPVVCLANPQMQRTALRPP